MVLLDGFSLESDSSETPPSITRGILARIRFKRNSPVDHKRDSRSNQIQAKIPRSQEDAVVVRLSNGFAIVSMRYDPEESVSGLPLTLAYAVTVAKVQGRTLTSIMIDPDLEAPGVAYCAMSRVRCLRDLWWLHVPEMTYFRPALSR